MATAQTPPNNNEGLIEFLEDLDYRTCGYGITNIINMLDCILRVLLEFSEMKMLSWTHTYLHKASGMISCTMSVLSIIQEAKIKNKLV